MAEEPLIDGDTPFNAIERYRLRKLMKNLERLEPGDVAEIKRIANSGKIVRGVVVFLAWFGGALTGALVLFSTAKAIFFGKVGG